MTTISFTFVSTAIIYISIAITNILTARYLGPNDFGILSIVFIWSFIVFLFGSIGLNNAIIYYIASGKIDLGTVISSSILIAVPASIIFGVLGYLIFPLILSTYPSNVVTWVSLYSAIYFPSQFLLQIGSGILQGKLLIKSYSFIRSCYAWISLLGIILLKVINQISIVSIMWAMLVGYILTALIFIVYIASKKWVRLVIDFTAIKSIVSYGFKTQIGWIASFGNLRFDQILMSLMIDPRLIGLYSVVVTLSSIVFIPSQAIALVSFPRISNTSSQEEKNEILGRYLKFSLVLSILTAIGMEVALPAILKYLYGDPYLPALSTGRLLLVGALFLSIRFQLEAGFRAANLPMTSSKVEILSLVVTMAGLFILLPLLGIFGAAVVSIIAYLTSLIYLISKVKISLFIDPFLLFTPKFHDVILIKNHLRRFTQSFKL